MLIVYSVRAHRNRSGTNQRFRITLLNIFRLAKQIRAIMICDYRFAVVIYRQILKYCSNFKSAFNTHTGNLLCPHVNTFFSYTSNFRPRFEQTQFKC